MTIRMVSILDLVAFCQCNEGGHGGPPLLVNLDDSKL